MKTAVLLLALTLGLSACNTAPVGSTSSTGTAGTSTSTPLNVTGLWGGTLTTGDGGRSFRMQISHLAGQDTFTGELQDDYSKPIGTVSGIVSTGKMTAVGNEGVSLEFIGTFSDTSYSGTFTHGEMQGTFVLYRVLLY